MLFQFRGVNVMEASCGRIKPENRKLHLHYYEIRHGDEPDKPVTIEPNVFVNYYGVIATDKPLTLKDDYLEITDDERVDFFYI